VALPTLPLAQFSTVHVCY